MSAEEIKKCLKEVTRYELTTRFYEPYIKEAKDGDYVSYEDYESLRRTTISMDTAQKLADWAVSSHHKDWCNMLKSNLPDDCHCGRNKALAQFEREKGDS